ncbi:TnsA endonuclease N-terminal domain-containing protein [Paenibacillus glycinis]|uniref:Heteromeric transposase endonuclease subunit TnsA n=1 Tax=Paenibacillus glycinis TaxID=2697035 RepID=A0ABW9XTI6_9BACL|nr:TnsA endonuclease N-terminal domain-containing protein [Paenibacillus glycinis]NBD25632.1 heteromeric transposase endonuclease subunit TnsA [Paenibacillus glycinis]
MSTWTKEKLNRFIKEGRGQGIGSKYVPWTKTHEFASKGRATRIHGIKTNRIHHLHSDNQLRAFFLFEWSEKVLDIRECFPLLDVMECIDNKDDLLFDKFRDKESGEPLVLTTNFVLTIRNAESKEVQITRTIKDSSEFSRQLTFEKLEIERRYWNSKGIEWKVITEKQLPRQVHKNIEWVRTTLLDENININKNEYSDLLLQLLIANYECKLADVLRKFDLMEGCSKGLGLYLFRYLIAKKKIKVDLKNKIDISSSIRELLL